MSFLGRLVVYLEGNIANFESAMGRAEYLANQSSKKIEASIKAADAALIGFAAGAGQQMVQNLGRTLEAAYTSTVKLAASLDDMAEKTGGSVERLSGFVQVAKIGGHQVDALEVGLTKLAKGMAGADDETKGAGKALEFLGIKAKDSAGNMRATDEVMSEVAKSLSRYADGAGKTAIAQELFGKSGAQLLPFLKDMAEYGDKVGKITAEQAARAEEYEKALGRLTLAKQEVTQAVALELLPAMTAVVEVMYKAHVESQKAAGSLTNLAENGSVRGWAEEMALALAQFVDYVKLTAATISALGESVKVVFADMKVGAVALSFNPSAIAAALDERNATLAKANKEWEALLNRDVSATRRSVEEQLKLQKLLTDAAAGKFDDARDRMARGAGKPTLNWASGGAGAAKPDKEMIDAIRTLNELRGKALGIDAAYFAGFDKLTKAYLAGKLPLDEYREAVQDLLMQHTAVGKEMMKTQEAHVLQRDAYVKSLEAARYMVSGMEEEVAALGMTNSEREISIRLRELEHKGIRQGSEDYNELAARIRTAVEAKEQFANSMSMWDELANRAVGFAQALTGGVGNALKYLREEAKRFGMELLAIFVKRYVLNLGASLIGGSGGGALSTAAGQVGQGTLSGAVSNYIGSLLTGTGTIGTALGQTGIMQFYGGMTGAIQGPGLTGAAGLGQQTAGMASGYAGALGIIGIIIAAGLWAMDLFKSGWRDTGGSFSGSTLAMSGGLSGIQGTDNRLLKMLGFSDRDAFTMSGGPIISRLFGWKQRQNDAFGVRGTFGAGGITGEQWQDWSQQGGLFRSDRRGTDVAAFSTDQAAFFASVFKGIGSIVSTVGRMVNIDPSTVLGGYSRAFDFQLNENGEPLSDEALQKLFGDFFGSVLQEQVAAVFDAGGRSELAEYVKALKGSGEEITAFIQELVGVMDSLDRADILGMSVETLMKFQKEGESLGVTFERVAGQWNQYQDLFLTEGEKVTLMQDALLKGFADLGIEMPISVEAFKQLVSGIDINTEAGRKLWEGLMALAPAFATVANASATLLAQFKQIAAQRNPGLARIFGEQDLEAAVTQFMQRNAWTQGMDWQEVARQIGLITSYAGGAADFARYKPEDQALILRILGITTQLEGLGNAAAGVAGALGAVGTNAGTAANDWLSIKMSLWQYLRGLYTNPQLSPLPPDQQLDTLKSRFATMVAQAQGGNIAAGQGLAGMIEQILQAGRAAYGSSSQYQDLFNWVTGLAGDFVQPGGAEELQRLVLEESQAQTLELGEIKNLLHGIFERLDSNAGELADATLEGAARVAGAVKARVVVR